ncbi:2-hydroxychromene-2-carboxylate isomerase [Falsiphaeobacter marinintestinus]|uniref:2-hydroxychromene-2-carboxylate isomerase n=1 Tax=Falsiphaeobacter marinintestinus TaxID=1492905 RepID=UPI0011B54D1F|nr:2-hydroxychromene-2-carboxylate isomerase [Phaeobacter marinintestinus]
MPANVEFIFDFASPNAYLVHQVLPRLCQRHQAELAYRPCLLGGIFKATGNQAPMMAFSNVKGKLEYERVEFQRFIRKHHLDRFQFNPHFPVNTLLMMRAAVACEIDGILGPYIEAGYRAMWEAGLKMSDPEVFVAAMDATGMDGAALLERAQTPEVKARLAENTDTAVKRGAFGIPTIFVDGEMFFGKERLGQVEEAMAAAR